MTEQEWLASTDPQTMLQAFKGQVSDRKLRLFACACCRQIWHLMTDDRSRAAVLAAERYADNLINDEEMAAARNEATRRAVRSTAVEVARYAVRSAAGRCAVEAAVEVARSASVGAAYAVADPTEAAWDAIWRASRRVQANILRDIVGNPYRPVRLPRQQITRAALSLATVAYAERDWGTLPILADALEDTGCDSEVILHHLRDVNAIHSRGCWVLDFVLGKQ